MFAKATINYTSLASHDFTYPSYWCLGNVLQKFFAIHKRNHAFEREIMTLQPHVLYSVV